MLLLLDCFRDVCSLRLHPDTTHAQLIGAVRCFAHCNGERFESFVACTAAGTLTSSAQQQLEEAGVRVEEYVNNKQPRGCDVFIVTRLLALALSSVSRAEHALPISKPSLLLLSDDRDLLLALSLLRRSGWFDRVVLVHSGVHEVDSLTPAITLAQLLQHYQPNSADSRLSQLAEQQEHVLIADWQQLSRSLTGGSIPGGLTPSTCDSTSAASTPSSPSCLSPSSTGECLQAFAAVVECCEREKIIPRESVLRKKLLDGRYGLGMEFEEFLSLVVDSGMAVVEGCSPQRVVWPREGHMARRFAW